MPISNINLDKKVRIGVIKSDTFFEIDAVIPLIPDWINYLSKSEFPQSQPDLMYYNVLMCLNYLRYW